MSVHPILWRKALVETHGYVFTPVPWSTWDGRGYEQMERKQCYSNALECAQSIDKTLTYVEGFGSHWHESRWWFHSHAWCIDDEGRVVDPTWRAHFANVPVENWRYFGIPFETPFASRLAEELHRDATDVWRYGILTPETGNAIEPHLAARGALPFRRPDYAFLADFDNSPAFSS